MRRIDGGQTDVPLQPIEQGGVWEVRRADKRGRQSGATFEQPGLRVELCGARIHGDPHLSTEVDELVHRTFLGGAHVGGRDHPHPAAPPHDLGYCIAEMAHTWPDHEGADQVDSVGATQFDP